MATKTGIQQALEKFDNSPTKLAQAIGGTVIRQHIEHWVKTGVVPAEKAPDVMAATGIAVDLLNPNVNWTAVRTSIAPKQTKKLANIAPQAMNSVAEQGA